MKVGDKVILDLESCFDVIDSKIEEYAQKQLLNIMEVKKILDDGCVEVIGFNGFCCTSNPNRLIPYKEFLL